MSPRHKGILIYHLNSPESTNLGTCACAGNGLILVICCNNRKMKFKSGMSIIFYSIYFAKCPLHGMAMHNLICFWYQVIFSTEVIPKKYHPQLSTTCATSCCHSQRFQVSQVELCHAMQWKCGITLYYTTIKPALIPTCYFYWSAS